MWRVCPPPQATSVGERLPPLSQVHEVGGGDVSLHPAGPTTAAIRLQLQPEGRFRREGARELEPSSWRAVHPRDELAGRVGRVGPRSRRSGGCPVSPSSATAALTPTAMSAGRVLPAPVETSVGLQWTVPAPAGKCRRRRGGPTRVTPPSGRRRRLRSLLLCLTLLGGSEPSHVRHGCGRSGRR